MLRIGITGPTGCGKTTFLREIRALGGEVVDCDALYYELLQTDPDLRAALEEAFGDVFLPDGSLNRPKLAACVFASAEQLAQLNEIVFFYIGRAVRTRKMQAQSDGAALFAIDAINLIESGLAEICDTTVAILAPENIRLARIMARDGLSAQAAKARIDAQKKDDFYRANCQYLLINDTTIEAFRERARRFLNSIIKEETP